MRIEFHRTGAERKELVNALGEILGVKPRYKGMPSAAYEIGAYTVTRDGALEHDDSITEDETRQLVERLAERQILAPETSGAKEKELQKETKGLTVVIPFDQVQVGNLIKLLEAKGNLIRKALGVADIRIEMQEGQVAFPWFGQVEGDEAAAYTHFISALCRMSKNAKRVTATEKKVENEKYAFRCFLLRLGFIGSEYKKERKILLKNLSGSSAFKDGGANHEISR